MKKTAVILVVVMALLITGAGYANCGHHQKDYSIEDAWIPEAPPVVKVLAGFMKIGNPTDQTQVLLGAESLAFEKIEMHRTVMEEGMAKMIQQKEIEIPAEGEVEFAPGGLHLMLINPNKPLKAREKITITLRFEGGKSIPVSFAVRPMEGMEHHHH